MGEPRGEPRAQATAGAALWPAPLGVPGLRPALRPALQPALRRWLGGGAQPVAAAAAAGAAHPGWSAGSLQCQLSTFTFRALLPFSTLTACSEPLTASATKFSSSLNCRTTGTQIPMRSNSSRTGRRCAATIWATSGRTSDPRRCRTRRTVISADGAGCPRTLSSCGEGRARCACARVTSVLRE